MPGSHAEIEAAETDLSARCRAALRPHIEDFLAEGFHTPIYRRAWQNIVPIITDDGACCLLHPSGRYYALVVYSRRWSPAKVSHEVVNLAVGAHFTSGRAEMVINSHKYQDPLPGTRVSVVEGGSARELMETLQRNLARYPAGHEPLLLTSVADMSSFYDKNNAITFAARLKRGSFVPMADEEIQAARAEQEANIRTEALLG